MGILRHSFDKSRPINPPPAQWLLLSPIALFIGLLSGLPVLALSVSVSTDGIDARRLLQPPYHLTGKKIAIGQVEGGRPGVFVLDKLAIPNSPVSVAQVLQLDGPAVADEYVDNHANHVASVMISQEDRKSVV